MNNLSFHITDITANSIRANASEIGLSVEEQDTRIVIRITDNGLGMLVLILFCYRHHKT